MYHSKQQLFLHSGRQEVIHHDASCTELRLILFNIWLSAKNVGASADISFLCTGKLISFVILNTWKMGNPVSPHIMQHEI